jgi:dephospho-CoA kinase
MATLIGITGGIGTGKSTVCRMLTKLGARIIDADRISRHILEPGQGAYSQVVDHFGQGVLDAAGRIDRAALGKIVFEDDEQRKVLESIMHPVIKDEIARQYNEFAREEGSCIVVLEAPLLIEAGMADTVDEVWVVACPEEEQLRRVMSRGLSYAEALARIQAQLPLAEKVKVADRVIDTGRSMEATEAEVVQIWCTICGCEWVS